MRCLIDGYHLFQTHPSRGSVDTPFCYPLNSSKVSIPLFITTYPSHAPSADLEAIGHPQAPFDQKSNSSVRPRLNESSKGTEYPFQRSVPCAIRTYHADEQPVLLQNLTQRSPGAPRPRLTTVNSSARPGLNGSSKGIEFPL